MRAGTPTTVAPGGDIAVTTAPAADRAPGADLHARHDGRADADQRPFATSNLATHVNARRDVHVVANHAVVIDGRAGVDDRVRGRSRCRC